MSYRDCICLTMLVLQRLLEKGYYNSKITVLGLDEMLLPVSPFCYQKHYR